MRRYFLLLPSILILFSVACAQESDADWPEVRTEHKPFTRWWWLGNAVDKENLTYNLEEFARAGIGGVEIASIYGVKGEDRREIQYLSDEWMAMYAHAASESERLGMIVDLTNGTGWPFGGPKTTVEDAATKLYVREYQMTGGSKLDEKIEYILPAPRGKSEPRQPRPGEITLASAMAYSKVGEKLDITDKVTDDGVLDWMAPDGDWTIYALFNGKTLQAVKRSSPGGAGLVFDHLSKTASEHYFQQFTDAFERTGAPMPRMFFNDSYEVYGADWTPTFLDEFAARRGYRLQDYLPEFLANDASETSRRVISDYRQTINDLLIGNFVETWIGWAHDKGVGIRNQSHGSPGNLIDIYARVDVPECETFGRTAFDIPGLQVDSGMRLNDSNPAVLKFASSAAHIAGKKLTSAETFTWLTEHFRTALSQAKPEIDQMFASGVNHVFFHGSPYSPKEAEWPGWRFYASVNMSPTNNIWRDAPAFFQYITRCQSFLQEGMPDNDFLLYFPIYDFWNNIRKNHFLTFTVHNLTDLLPAFNRTVSDIMDAGYDFDYISDAFIASLKFEDGELVTSGGARYQALIIPDNQYMPTETLEKILALTEQGATVVFAGRYPNDVPGLNELTVRRANMQALTTRLPEEAFGDEAAVHSFGKGQLITGKNYATLLPATGTAPESFKADFGGQYNRRDHKDGHIYFMSMLRNETIDGWVTLAKPAESVMIFDPLTGEKGLAQVRNQGGKTQVYLQLQPDESVILKTFTKKTVKSDAWSYLKPESRPLNIDKGWLLTFVESAPAIEGTFDIDTLMSWTELSHENAKVNMGTALYKTTFVLPEMETDDWELNLGELHESAKVRINGQEAGTIFAIPYTLLVGRYLRPGENMIEVEATNLPANRIRDYDKRGVEWRIFKDINMVNVFYSPMQYDVWDVTPSGLVGPVKLTPMKSVF